MLIVSYLASPHPATPPAAAAAAAASPSSLWFTSALLGYVLHAVEGSGRWSLLTRTMIFPVTSTSGNGGAVAAFPSAHSSAAAAARGSPQPVVVMVVRVA